MFQIASSPFTSPEMFDGNALEDDEKWIPVGTVGKARPLLFDVSHGSWISILRARGAGNIARHRHANPVTA